MGWIIAGLDRKTATEFSFFLAIPIIFAAATFDLVSNFNILNKSDIPIFLVGFITAFISSYLVIKIFIKFVAHNTFIGFGWYRIIVGDGRIPETPPLVVVILKVSAPPSASVSSLLKPYTSAFPVKSLKSDIVFYLFSLIIIYNLNITNIK